MKIQLSLNPLELCGDHRVFRQHELTDPIAQSKKYYRIKLPHTVKQERAAKRKSYILSCLEERDEAEEDGQAALSSSRAESNASPLGNFAEVRALCNRTRRIWQDEFLIDLKPKTSARKGQTHETMTPVRLRQGPMNQIETADGLGAVNISSMPEINPNIEEEDDHLESSAQRVGEDENTSTSPEKRRQSRLQPSDQARDDVDEAAVMVSQKVRAGAAHSQGRQRTGADSSRESLQQLAKRETEMLQRLVKLHHENEAERKNYILGKDIYSSKKNQQRELGGRKANKHRIPITYKMHERAKLLSQRQTDYSKSGVLTMQDEGVPPGMKFSHLGLQQLYQNRLRSLELSQRKRHFDEKLLQK